MPKTPSDLDDQDGKGGTDAEEEGGERSLEAITDPAELRYIIREMRSKDRRVRASKNKRINELESELEEATKTMAKTEDSTDKLAELEKEVSTLKAENKRLTEFETEQKSKEEERRALLLKKIKEDLKWSDDDLKDFDGMSADKIEKFIARLTPKTEEKKAEEKPDEKKSDDSKEGEKKSTEGSQGSEGSIDRGKDAKPTNYREAIAQHYTNS